LARPRIKYGLAWRRLVCCLAAYAIVVQSLLVGLLGAHVAASGLAKDALPAFEICRNGPDSAAETADEAPQDHGSAGHCHLCVVACHYTLAAPVVSTIAILIAASDGVFRLSEQWQSRAFPRHSRANPRGPPLTV
jgi:hypothetical protein